ncbi:hypothetical protein FO519_002758 [Halicephalobus sp. NKZ332]|nr:hypothetical protein FO519_002758 [Halicephalobus sp. NKZ332]
MADQNPANTSFGGISIISRVTTFKTHRFTVVVQLLDDTEQLSLQFKGSELGQKVLDSVCDQLDIVEKDYFGLRYQDNNKYRFWLDLTKPLNKQFKGDHLSLSLRFRFYPRDFTILRENVTKYQLFVQLRRDLLHGRLYCSQQTSITLAALILQSVIGDYDPSVHHPGYVSEYKLLLKQTERLEERIAEVHQQLAGLPQADAESRFLSLATEIDTYGFDPYVVKDAKQNQDLIIGATCHGVLVFSKNNLLNDISWDQIVKIDYTGKELKIYPTRGYVEDHGADRSTNGDLLNATASTIGSGGSLNGSKTSYNSKLPKIPAKKEKFKFICSSSFFAKHLWRHLLSQLAFYTEEKAKLVKPVFSKSRIPIFFRGSTFRLPTKKVLHEIEAEQVAPRPNQPVDFPRYPLPKQIPRSELEVSVSSRTATLRSGKHSPRILIEEPDDSFMIKTSGGLGSQETLTNANVKPASSTPKQSTSQLPEFVFTPSSVECVGNQMIDTSIETKHSTTSVKTTSDESIVKRPTKEVPMANHIVQTEETAIYANKISNGTSRSNGKANGHTNEVLKKDEEVTKKGSGLLKNVLSFTFVLTVLSIFVVASFEANDGNGISWIRDFSTIASFRQVIYEPSKDYIQQVVSRFH